MHKFIDLFSGIGGFRIAMQRQGMDCVFSSDIDKHARQSYQKNFNETPEGDITKISEKNIPSHDVLCAGFPCQAFSLSGKSKGFADDRGRLFFEIIRIAKHHKPYIMVLENVKNILTIDNGEVIKQIYHSLSSIGYSVKHYMLNAGDFGVPQKRERVYFIAIRKDTALSHGNPIKSQKAKYIKDIVVPDNLTDSLIIKRDDIRLNNKEITPQPRPLRIGIVNKGGQGERIYSEHGHAITLSANGGGVGARTGLYQINNKIRKLHIDEAKAVMGFDKRHIVSDGIQGYKQLGNAVIPKMVEQVYNSVRVR